MGRIAACERHEAFDGLSAKRFTTDGIRPGWFSCEFAEGQEPRDADGSLVLGYSCIWGCRWAGADSGPDKARQGRLI